MREHTLRWVDQGLWKYEYLDGLKAATERAKELAESGYSVTILRERRHVYPTTQIVDYR